jgi:hypothetical protein
VRRVWSRRARAPLVDDDWVIVKGETAEGVDEKGDFGVGQVLILPFSGGDALLGFGEGGTVAGVDAGALPVEGDVLALLELDKGPICVELVDEGREGAAELGEIAASDGEVDARFVGCATRRTLPKANIAARPHPRWQSRPCAARR